MGNDVEIFEKFLKLRGKIDSRIEQLEKEHRTDMQCKEGCDSCCIKFRILPIEFEYIKSKLGNRIFQKPKRFTKKCVFLKNSICQIYEHRPIICRSHGVPMLYMNKAGTDWELGHCKLNFKNIDKSTLNIDNTFAQDRFNSDLYLLNKEYIGNYNSDYKINDLIDIKYLLKKY